MWWVPVTLFAAGTQVLRNGLQSGLTSEIGTLGSAMVRFVYALPFVCVLYPLLIAGTGSNVPPLTPTVLLWAAGGALAQIAATALMLKAMELRGFAVAYAYIKMEPVMLALGGYWILGDALTPLAWAGIVLATAGVMWAALPDGAGLGALLIGARPVAIGLSAGALFGLSAIGFRAAIMALPDANPVMNALHILIVALVLQTAILGTYLAIRQPEALRGSLRLWRRSFGAGLAGALASFAWFVGFALTAAANVRTLGLVEMPIAALLARRLTGKAASRRELVGIALVLIGIALLLQQAAS